MMSDDLEVCWSGGALLPPRPERVSPVWIGRTRTRYALAERHRTGPRLPLHLRAGRRVSKPHQRWDEAIKRLVSARVQGGEPLCRVCRELQVSISTAREWVGR